MRLRLALILVLASLTIQLSCWLYVIFFMPLSTNTSFPDALPLPVPEPLIPSVSLTPPLTTPEVPRSGSGDYKTPDMVPVEPSNRIGRVGYSTGPATILDKEIRLPKLGDMSSETEENDVVLNYLLHKYRETIGQVKRQMLLRVTNADPVIVQNTPHCDNKEDVLNVASLNLWNLNPPWDQRRKKIVEFLRREKPDIVGFQEVKFVGHLHQAQQIVDDLKPEITYNVVFCDVQPEPVGRNEGMAIISKYKITTSGSVSLKGGSPRNRKIFYAAIDIPFIGEVYFFVTHLTYEESKQCDQMMTILSYLDTFDPNKIQILVGDFNTYFDFEWPMDLAVRPINKFTHHRYNPCHNAAKSLQLSKTPKFRDAWEDVFPDMSRFPGSTFPNFQDQRAAHLDPCRPDRILIRNNNHAKNLITCDTYLFGQEMFQWKGKDGAGVMRTGMKISDHKGIMTQLVWRPGEEIAYAEKVRKVQNWRNPVARPSPVAAKVSSPERYQNLHVNSQPTPLRPASIETSIPNYLTFNKWFAFDGDPNTFFWSNRPPNAGETFDILLNHPFKAKMITISTGCNQMNAHDKVLHAVLEVSAGECGVNPLGSQKLDGMGKGRITLDPPRKIKCIRLGIEEAQENWVIINDVSIR
ncbi:hypothetical protein AAMO2058_000692200 [Amorphochlora amoebiformis]